MRIIFILLLITIFSISSTAQAISYQYSYDHSNDFNPYDYSNQVKYTVEDGNTYYEEGMKLKQQGKMSKAILKFKAAAARNNNEAMIELYDYYIHKNHKTVEDYSFLKKYLKSLADNGYVFAAREYGYMLIACPDSQYTESLQTSFQYIIPEGLKYLQQAIRGGDSEACIIMGYLWSGDILHQYSDYQPPIPVFKRIDYDKASEYFIKAKDLNDSLGWAIYGKLLYDGNILTKNRAEAKIWLQKAYNAGERKTSYDALGGGLTISQMLKNL